MLIRPNMKWCCVIKVYIRHPTQSFIYIYQRKEILYVLFFTKGFLEFSMSLGYLIGPPIGGGLQEVRELELSGC